MLGFWVLSFLQLGNEHGSFFCLQLLTSKKLVEIFIIFYTLAHASNMFEIWRRDRLNHYISFLSLGKQANQDCSMKSPTPKWLEVHFFYKHRPMPNKSQQNPCAQCPFSWQWYMLVFDNEAYIVCHLLWRRSLQVNSNVKLYSQLQFSWNQVINRLPLIRL